MRRKSITAVLDETQDIKDAQKEITYIFPRQDNKQQQQSSSKFSNSRGSVTSRGSAATSRGSTTSEGSVTSEGLRGKIENQQLLNR